MCGKDKVINSQSIEISETNMIEKLYWPNNFFADTYYWNFEYEILQLILLLLLLTVYSLQ